MLGTACLWVLSACMQPVGLPSDGYCSLGKVDRAGARWIALLSQHTRAQKCVDAQLLLPHPLLLLLLLACARWMR